MLALAAVKRNASTITITNMATTVPRQDLTACMIFLFAYAE